MTRIILITVMLFAATSASSQITKDNWMLGGIISYASTKYNSTNFGDPHTSYNLQVKPNIGYFLVDKLSAGLRANISKVGDRDREQSYTDFNVGPYLRYYLLKSDKVVNILAEAGYSYGFEKGSTPGNASKNSFSFAVGPVMYFNSVVGLEMLLSYSTYKFSDFAGSNNTIMLGIGLQVHLEKEK